MEQETVKNLDSKRNFLECEGIGVQKLLVQGEDTRASNAKNYNVSRFIVKKNDPFEWKVETADV
jgi:hypothetical protein